MNASRMLSLTSITADGSPEGTSASGKGCSHGISRCSSTFAMSGVADGPFKSTGRTSRSRPSNHDKQAFVAIRYSQVRIDPRDSSYPSANRQARSIVSCTRSSASCSDPSIR